MIPVYKFETDAGLEDLIREQNSISFSSLAKVDINPIVLKSVANSNPDQIDLFYLDAILASVGWNKNDDIFLKEEVLAAKDTPVDKQFNYMHDEKDIIGHITSSKLYDGTNFITDLDNVPEQFDIIVSSVIYKHWTDKNLQERINKLIAGIKENKWYVSMECLFPNFDYAVITPEGQQKIIARTEESSFLTKHLRIYKGSGEYNGYKIGRIPRNFTFSGKGLVDNPANPRSVILNSNDSFTGAAASVNIFPREQKMSDVKTVSLEEFNALKDELNTAKASLKAVSEQEINKYKDSLAVLEKSKAEIQVEVDNLKSLSKEKDSKISTLETELAKANDNATKVQAELGSIKLEQAKNVRVAKLVTVGVESEKAKALVEKFASASDEMFDEVVALHKSQKPENKSAEIKTDIETAKADIAPVSQESEDSTKTLRSVASAWIRDNMQLNVKGTK